MRKAGLIILLFAVFIDTPFFRELLKLPALFNHYSEHHALDNRVDLKAFLAMHYWGNDLNDNDDDKDMQLPFKKADCHIHSQTAFPIAKLLLESPAIHLAQVWPAVYDPFNDCTAINDLFRPPRA